MLNRSRFAGQLVEGIYLCLVAPILLVTPQPFLLPILLTIGLIFVWLYRWRSERVPLLPQTPFTLPVWFLCGTVVIGVIVSSEITLTTPKAVNFILGIAWWRWLVNAIDDEQKLHRAVWFVIGVGIFLVMVGVFSADWHIKPATFPTRLPTPLTRFTGGIHPNQIAGTILLFAPLLPLLYATERNRHRKIVQIALFFACATVLLLTQSRSGWLGAIGGAVALLILWQLSDVTSRRRSLWLLGLVVVAIITSLFIFDWHTYWLEPPQQTSIGSFETLSFRQSVWQWGGVAVTDFPLTGIGLGTFREVARTLYPIDAPPTFDIAHAHNLFLQIAIDVGLIGLIAYVALLMLVGTLCWRVIRIVNKQNQVIALGIITCLIAFHIYGLTDTIALGAKPHLLFWLLLALANGVHRLTMNVE